MEARAKARVRAGLLSAGCLWLAAGCAAPIRVATDYDPAVDLTALRGWSWFPEPRARSGNPRLDDPLLDARIRRAVEAELSIRGYPRSVGLEPDFLVTYHVALDRRLDVQTLHRYYGPAWRVEGVGETVVHEYEEGTLLLDFLDPRSRQLVWRGSAQARVTRNASPEQRDQRIREAVRRMLERFPPRPRTPGS